MNQLPWVGIARCTAAADRASSISGAFGQDATRTAVAESLERLWQVAGGSLGPETLHGMDLVLEATLDPASDDSHSPSYDAMSATAITAYAIQAALDPARIDDVLDAAVDLWSGIDFALLADSRGRLDASPHWIGDLEKRERKAQDDDLRSALGKGRAQAVDMLRGRALRAREELRDILRIYARLRGWDDVVIEGGS